MATPAQIANDMAAQAAYWHRRDDATSDACRDCAFVIRKFLSGQLVDGRTFHGLQSRLEARIIAAGDGRPSIRNSLRRGLECMRMLKSQTSRRELQERMR